MHDPRGLSSNVPQHAEVRLGEVAEAAYVPVERDGDEVERAERGEVPLHVWQNEVAGLGGGVAEDDLLGFRGAVEYVLDPASILLNTYTVGKRCLDRPLRARWRERRDVRLHDALVECWHFVHDGHFLLRVLPDVNFSRRVHDVDLDIRTICGLRKPSE